MGEPDAEDADRVLGVDDRDVDRRPHPERAKHVVRCRYAEAGVVDVGDDRETALGRVAVVPLDLVDRQLGMDRECRHCSGRDPLVVDAHLSAAALDSREHDARRAVELTEPRQRPIGHRRHVVADCSRATGGDLLQQPLEAAPPTREHAAGRHVPQHEKKPFEPFLDDVGNRCLDLDGAAVPMQHSKHRRRVLTGATNCLGQHPEGVPHVVRMDVVEDLQPEVGNRIEAQRHEGGGGPAQDAVTVDDQQDVGRRIDRSLGKVHESNHRPTDLGVDGAGLNVTPPVHHVPMASATVRFHPAFERVLRNVVRDVAKSPVVLTVPEQVDPEVLAGQVLRYAQINRCPLEVLAEPGCVRVRLGKKGGRVSA